MTERLSSLLKSWELQDWEHQEDIFLDLSVVQYLGDNVFGDYEPSQFDPFEDRLDRWLHNLTDEADQRTLFLILNHLFFIGRPEFESLCRAAYNGQLLRWMVDQLVVDIARPDGIDQIERGLEHTWICPITDSMRINSFLKANRLDGRNHRPDWRSLRKFGDLSKIGNFIRDREIKRLVLLEDFVGTGTQMRGVIEFATQLPTALQILALPLVTCPDGDKVGRDLARDYPNLSYEAVLVIPESTLIKADAQQNEPPFYKKVRDLIAANKNRFQNDHDASGQDGHGFKGTGAVVAMYSNCPNNTLPIIHQESSSWSALFPRIRRF